MPTLANMDDVMVSLGEARLIQLDGILREGFETYMSITPEIRLEHDARAQASCIYSHIAAAADRAFELDEAVRSLDVSKFKLWILDDADAVISFKKMNDMGITKSYPTQQQKNFERQLPLDSVELPPVRLRVGYVLDAFQTSFLRSQIAMPNGKDCFWCSAIHGPDERTGQEQIWYDALEGKVANLF